MSQQQRPLSLLRSSEPMLLRLLEDLYNKFIIQYREELELDRIKTFKCLQYGFVFFLALVFRYFNIILKS